MIDVRKKAALLCMVYDKVSPTGKETLKDVLIGAYKVSCKKPVSLDGWSLRGIELLEAASAFFNLLPEEMKKKIEAVFGK